MPNRYKIVSLLLVTIGILLLGQDLGDQSLEEFEEKNLPTAVRAIQKAGPCPSENCLDRFGVGGEYWNMLNGYDAGLPFGVYYDWLTNSDPPTAGHLDYWQMVRTTANGPSIPPNEISEIIKRRPGSVWIIGNEPDNIYQDNIEAEEYAELYHELYQVIKTRDPRAAIAIAGVSQPTALRLEYLERVLASYEEKYSLPMPVDIWTIHGYILREEAGSWGADIPPGFDVSSGELYDIEDHGDIEIFKENLLQFRAWMDENGYKETPLAVTELGILLPMDFGFSDEIVGKFMTDAYDFLSDTKGGNGWARDNNRLFQWWFWYSLYDDYVFPTGDLYDPDQDLLTPLGEIMRDYIGGEQQGDG